VIDKPSHTDFRSSQFVKALEIWKRESDAAPPAGWKQFSTPVGQWVFALFIFGYSMLGVLAMGAKPFAQMMAIIIVPIILYKILATAWGIRRIMVNQQKAAG
jgi:hypothetical protein